jgi:hypothetical protein
MEKDEAFDPVDVCLFRLQRIMFKADRFADAVEQFALALTAFP